MSGITELKETPIVSTQVRQVEGQNEGQMEVNMAQTYRYYSPAPASDRFYTAPRSNQTAPQTVYTQPRYYNESPLPPKRRSQRSQPTPVFVYPDVPPEPKPEYSCNGDDCCGCFNWSIDMHSNLFSICQTQETTTTTTTTKKGRCDFTFWVFIFFLLSK